MSVPLLLTVLDSTSLVTSNPTAATGNNNGSDGVSSVAAIAGASVGADSCGSGGGVGVGTTIVLTSQTGTTMLMDEHLQAGCISFVEAAATLENNYNNQIDDNEFEVNDIDVTSSHHLNNQTSSTSCIPVIRKFRVQLNGRLNINERLGLTGNCDALGNWNLSKCIQLVPQATTAENQYIWSAEVLLKPCLNIRYRYFVYIEDNQQRRQIRFWETCLTPRTIDWNKINNDDNVETDNFGEVGIEFGQYGDTNTLQINRGWLTHESIIQFKFEHEDMFQIVDVDRFDPENVLIKVEPLDLTEPLTTLDAPHELGINIEVVKLCYGESQLRPQQVFGTSFKHGDVVIFHITVPSTINYGFVLLFHTLELNPIGKAFIMPDQIIGSEGNLELTITEPEEHSFKQVAHIRLPYLVVRPFINQASLDFQTTYAHYWPPKSWPNLDVGHRGNGRSYKADAPIECENTLASFMRAYEMNADMVELDVHLTADHVPIIYHDFGVKTAPQGKTITDVRQLQYVLIKDITYEALKQLRVFAVINDKPIEYSAHNAETRLEHRIFPRLVDVLSHLPKALGIDVEIKWPQRRACGSVEARQTIDKNFFIDRVLSVVIEYGCGRPLVFSSFDADICTMLRFKQNLFPVLYLTMGETKKWLPFMDLRTRTFEQAVNNAQAFELAGIAPHAEDLIGENGINLMQKARNLGQIVLVWGDDCNSKERVKYFKDIGATATCYDRMDLYIDDDKKRSFFNDTTLLAEFEGQCRLIE